MKIPIEFILNPSPTQSVLAYLEENGSSEVKDIAAYLGMNTNSVRTILCRARNKGEARKIKKPGGVILWELGPDEKWEPKEPYEHGWPARVTVSEWEPCMVRDPLIDAFFGRAG